MQKKQWIDFLRTTLDPSGASKRFPPQMCEWAITMATNQLFSAIPESEYDNFDFWTHEFTAQSVTLDATRGLYYSTLPASLIPLKIPAEAVRHVNTSQGTDLDFCPCTETDWELMDGLFGDDTDNTILYIVRYDRIWYKNMTAPIAGAGVRLVLATPFSEFTDTEEVNIPFGDVNIIQMAVQILIGTPPMNQKNNNAL